MPGAQSPCGPGLSRVLLWLLQATTQGHDLRVAVSDSEGKALGMPQPSLPSARGCPS